jgi:hypothetical protein
METLSKIQYLTPQQNSLGHTSSGRQNTVYFSNNGIQRTVATNEDGVQSKNHVYTCRTSGLSSDDNKRIQTNNRFSNNLIQIRNFKYAKIHTNLLFE